MQVNNANIDLDDAGDEVTFYKGDGTSTETAIYMDIDQGVSKVHIANDKDFEVVAINGNNFTNPRSVTASTGFGFTSTNEVGIQSIKIRASEAGSHFEVMMW